MVLWDSKGTVLPEVGEVGEASTFNYSTCNPDQCTSTNGFFGQDCIAGSQTEACSCGGGLSAKQLYAWPVHSVWNTQKGQMDNFYEYTCCEEQLDSTGEDCGDYDEYDAWLKKLITTIVYSVIGGCCCLAGLGAGIFFLCAAKNKPPHVGDIENNNNNTSHVNGIEVHSPSAVEQTSFTDKSGPPSYSQ